MWWFDKKNIINYEYNYYTSKEKMYKIYHKLIINGQKSTKDDVCKNT